MNCSNESLLQCSNFSIERVHVRRCKRRAPLVTERRHFKIFGAKRLLFTRGAWFDQGAEVRNHRNVGNCWQPQTQHQEQNASTSVYHDIILLSTAQFEHFMPLGSAIFSFGVIITRIIISCPSNYNYPNHHIIIITSHHSPAPHHSHPPHP